MQLKPIIESQSLVSSICSNTAAQVSTKPSALNLRPSKDFTWDVPIVTAAAVVNPAITGAAINSIRNPKEERVYKGKLYEFCYPFHGRLRMKPVLNRFINYLN